MRHRRHKAITAAWNIRHIAGAVAAVAERPPQACDMEFEAAIVDLHIRPDAVDQIPFGDDLPWMFGETNQNIQ